MILSGGALGGGTVYGVNSTAVGGLSMVMEASVPSGTYTMTLPCFDQHHDINFSNNLITNTADERNYCHAGGSCGLWAGCGAGCGGNGSLFYNSAQRDIVQEHNTILPSNYSANSGLIQELGTNLGGTRDYSGTLTVRNNVEPIGANGFLSGGGGGCGFEFTGASINLRKNIWTTETPTSQTWPTFATGSVTPGCTTPAIWPTDHAGGFSWTSIISPTTFKVTSATYQNWGTDGRDPGANVDRVNALTATALSGAPNPFLDAGIRSLQLTSAGNGVTVKFAAPDTAACTWKMSTDAGTYTSPVAVSSQARSGRQGTATWNNGTLTAGTAYWAQMTCGSYPPIETLVNGSRAMVITAPASLIAASSYDVINGNWHSLKMLDYTYSGSGSNTTSESVLTGGSGILTDGVVGHQNPFWFNPIDQYGITSTVITQPGGPGTADIFTFTLDRSNDIVGGEVDVLAIDGSYHIPYVRAYTATNSPSVVQTDQYGSSDPSGIPALTSGVLTKLYQHSAVDPASHAYNWIAWAIDSANPPQTTDTADTRATMTFHFAAPHLFNQCSLYTAVWNDYSIGAFGTATFDFSTNGTTWTTVGTGSVQYTSTSPDRVDRRAFWLNIPLGGVTASHVRMHLSHIGGAGAAGTVNNFIALSEVQFQ